MTPVYLKFPDKTTAVSALTSVGWHDGQVSLNTNMDLVGVVPGQSGWHVNALVEVTPPSLVQYVVVPATPYRVFAGWSTEEMAARGM